MKHMLLRALLIQSLLFTSLARAQQASCVQSLSKSERSELAFLKQAIRNSQGSDPQFRQVISKRLAAMSPAARVAVLALVSEWNFQNLAQQLRRQPSLAAAFNEFNEAFEQYQKNRERFAGGQWEQKRDEARIEQAKQKLIINMRASTLPSERKMAFIQAANAAVANLRNHGSQRMAEGAQLIRGGQAGAVVVGGAVVSAGLIWLSVVTLGATAPAAGATTTATATAFLAMLGAGAAGGAGTVGLVGSASIVGNAAISANANRQSFFCTLAQQTSAQGASVIEHALQAAVFAGMLTGGLTLLPTAAGQIVAGLVVAGGTGATLVQDGIEGTEAYRLLEQAQQAAARGDTTHARQLYAESQRLALEAGLDIVAAAAGAGLVIKGAVASKRAPTPKMHEPLHGNVIHEVISEPSADFMLSTAMADNDFIGPNGEWSRLNMKVVPDDLKGSFSELRFASIPQSQLRQKLIEIILAHLQKRGIKAEVLSDVKLHSLNQRSTLIRILPFDGQGTPHWLNTLAAQMAKAPTNESVAFNADLALIESNVGAAYNHQQDSIAMEEQHPHFLILPLEDLSTDKMSHIGVHEWIHFQTAQAAYVRGETYQGWFRTWISLRGTEDINVRHFYWQVEEGYRLGHSADEVYAHFRQARVIFQNLERDRAQGVTSKNAVNDLQSLESCLQRVKSLGEYDAYGLNQILSELKTKKSTLALNQKISASASSTNFDIRFPAKLLAKEPDPSVGLARLIEAHLQALSKVMAEAAQMQEHIHK